MFQTNIFHIIWFSETTFFIFFRLKLSFVCFFVYNSDPWVSIEMMTIVLPRKVQATTTYIRMIPTSSMFTEGSRQLKTCNLVICETFLFVTYFSKFFTVFCNSGGGVIPVTKIPLSIDVIPNAIATVLVVLNFAKSESEWVFSSNISSLIFFAVYKNNCNGLG